MSLMGEYRYLLLVSVFMFCGSTAEIPNASEFFEAEDDASRITWAHAVNSKADLAKYLDDDTTMMLEADVSSGHLLEKLDEAKPIPVMAHPPIKTSDLSLAEFLSLVMEANDKGQKKGVKLDFKDIASFKSGVNILKEKISMVTFPLWLNADILEGPASPKKPVDADIFLKLSTELFPMVTLSLGWTTGPITDSSITYTGDMVQKMVSLIEKYDVSQPVTFPIRSALVGNSLEVLIDLLQKVPDSSITLWTSSSDDVDLSTLYTLQESVGEDDVYFDLPESLMMEFNLLRQPNLDASAPTIRVFPQQTCLYLTVAAIMCAVVALYILD